MKYHVNTVLYQEYRKDGDTRKICNYQKLSIIRITKGRQRPQEARRLLIFWRLDGGVWGSGVGWGRGNNVLFDFYSIVSVRQHMRHATLLDVLLQFHTYVVLRCWMFSCSSTHTSCYAAGCFLALPHIRHATLLDVLLHIHTYVMLRCGMFSCTSIHTSCYAAGCSLALPYIRHATLLDVLLHFHTYVMLRCWMFSCTSTHTSFYADGCSLALPHIRHSTLLDVLLHLYVMLRCWMFSCTSTHTSCYSCFSTQTSCYAAGCSLAFPHIRHATLLDVLLHFHTYVMLRCYAAGCSLAHPYIRHATLLDVLLQFHTYVMLRCWMFSCTYTSCYAAGCSLALPHIRHATLAFSHIRHATLLDVLLHFHTYVMLRCYAAGCSLAHPYIRHATLYQIVQITTVSDISIHFHHHPGTVMSSPTRPLTDVVTLFHSLSCINGCSRDTGNISVGIRKIVVEFVWQLGHHTILDVPAHVRWSLGTVPRHTNVWFLWFFPHWFGSLKRLGMSQNLGTFKFHQIDKKSFRFSAEFGVPHFGTYPCDYKVAKKNVFRLTGGSNVSCLSCAVLYHYHTFGNLSRW